jgi:hypothetical protein
VTCDSRASRTVSENRWAGRGCLPGSRPFLGDPHRAAVDRTADCGACRPSLAPIEFHLLESIEIGDYASVAACLDYGYDWSFHSNPWGEKRKRKREFSPHHHHRFLPTGGGDHHQVDDYHEDDDDDLESIELRKKAAQFDFFILWEIAIVHHKAFE